MTEVLWPSLPELALPGSDDLIYPPEEAPSSGDRVPRFKDRIWPVRFFSANPSIADAKINWDTYTERYRGHLKLATWTLFNLPLPDEFLNGPSMRSILSALRIYHSACDWRMFGRWLDARGVASLNDVGTRDLEDYATYLREERRVRRNTAINHLTALTRLWIAGRQVPELALAGPPPWIDGDLDDYLPPATGTGENITATITTGAISALLSWAITTVNECADQILEAQSFFLAVRAAGRTQRTDRSAAEDRIALRTWFEQIVTDGAPLPVKTAGRQTVLDNAYIAYQTGCSIEVCWGLSKRHDVRAYKDSNRAEPLFEFRPSRSSAGVLPRSIPVVRIPYYVDLLEAACFIVVAYLTGMRPGEVLALEAGSLRPSQRSGGWMLIESRTFKRARDENGNHASQGELRAAPWVAIVPVAHAIRTLERLHPSGLLLPSTRKSAGISRSMAHNTMADRVDRFITHINHLNPGAIAEDPRGRITPSRFRRTLAWHIANQPGGLVALAVQYGHLRTAISEGYANRTRDGIQELIDFETARSIARRLSEAQDDFNNGDGVSGPSAMRFVSALREQEEEYRGIVTSERQARSLLRNPALTVYRNDQALLWCNWRRSSAKCMTTHENEEAPRLDNCSPNCGNVALTDTMATRVLERADQYELEARALPRPMADRRRRAAERLRARAERHFRERKTRGDLDDEQR